MPKHRKRTDPKRIQRKTSRADTVYKIVDVVGVSETSGGRGPKRVETAAESLRDRRVAEVTKMDMRVETGKSQHSALRVSLSFKYESAFPVPDHPGGRDLQVDSSR
jgi:flavin-binding protein dodecin